MGGLLGEIIKRAGGWLIESGQPCLKKLGLLSNLKDPFIVIFRERRNTPNA
jgi:hypothetical protein